MFILFPRFRVRVSVFALPILLLLLWLEGAMPFFLMIGSAALHELGHIAAMHFCGYRIRRLDILPMGALIVCPEGIPNRDECIIALAGPFVSLCAAAAASAWFMLGNSVDALFAVLINLVLGVFNLLPVRKLDGGKALCCFLADRKSAFAAERICKAASHFSILLFLAFAAFCIAATNFNLGAILLSATLIFQLFV